jgi:ATP-dependent DNA ligase
MLARSATELPTVDGWAYEPKLDGFRAVLTVSTTGKVRLQSRRQGPLAPYFPEIVEAAGVLPPGVRLDGELVVPRNGGFDFAALQQHSHPAAKRVHQLGRELPAALVAFDLLQLDGQDLRGEVHDDRRARLVELLGGRSPSIGVMPQTTSAAAASVWLSGQPGVEGCVAKRRQQVYRPGVRAWRKLRAKATTEGVVGGVLGPLQRPTALILGLADGSGRLRVIGCTSSLPAAARVELGAVLTAPVGRHPWPEMLPANRFGQRPGDRVSYTRAEPVLVVEFEHDAAWERGRFRHPTTFVRLRSELRPSDLSAPDRNGMAWS